MEKNQIKLGTIVRVDGGPCGRVVEIDNERSSYPYKVRYSGGLAEWASANQMEEILDAPEESVRAGCTREEAVARWNSFVLTMKSQEK